MNKIILATAGLLLLIGNVGAAGQNLVCYGEDALSVEINANSGWMKVVIEGEGGWTKIFRTQRRPDGSRVFISKNGALLVLNERNASFKLAGDTVTQQLKCR